MEATAIKPVPVHTIENGKKKTYERVMIKFSAEEINKLKMIGRFYLPENIVMRGYYTLEIGEAIAVSDGEKQIKVGDKLLTTYSLMSIDRSNDGKNLRHGDWIEEDEYGNQYCCPQITTHNIFGIVKSKSIEPLNGTIICDPPIKEQELTSSIIFLDHLKKSNSDNKAYRAKVRYISKQDSKEFGIKKGDIIVAKKNSDIPIKVKNEELIRIPINFVVAKE